ncbi:hypothetical protein TNCV_3104341, partial [Trichonephila clavipes]
KCPLFTQLDRQRQKGHPSRPDSPPLRDDVTPPDKRFTSDVTPHQSSCSNHTARKARLLESHNELSRLLLFLTQDSKRTHD